MISRVFSPSNMMWSLNTRGSCPLPTSVDFAPEHQGGGLETEINLSESCISLTVASDFYTDDELKKKKKKLQGEFDSAGIL